MKLLPLLPLEVFTRWLASGERGLSSEAIVARLTGERVGRYSHGDHPYDIDDFRRCEKLLDQVPLARACLTAMADISPTWTALVAHWHEIAALDKTDPAAANRLIYEIRDAASKVAAPARTGEPQ